MANLRTHSRTATLGLLVLPVILFFYTGLFLTMLFWYPAGLARTQWQAHLLHFSIVYIFWLAVFFSYQLFDLDSLRRLPRLLVRLLAVAITLVVIAVVYFYFQPELLITPRRFLLVHTALSMVGISLWYAAMHLVLPRTWQTTVFAHPAITDHSQLSEVIKEHEFLGLRFGGTAPIDSSELAGTMLVFPSRINIDTGTVQSLYSLRRQGVRFVEFYDFYEILTRRVHLETLTELWFLHSVDYGSHYLSDTIKRGLDIIVAIIGMAVLALLLPILAILIKLTSAGPVFFTQYRVGKDGVPFKLYKFRTMSGGATDTWTADRDPRITAIGRVLRLMRLDEIPQSINVLRGEMSLVGPRPEQVQIVEQLKQEIPYYDERHIVKPGITGWAQLHVYAGNLQETKRKLQYDLYYIKHRGILFDLEIILRTIYKVISFGGR